MTWLPWTLVALPVLPVLAALVLSLARRIDRPLAIHAGLVLAGLAVLVALFMPPLRLELPEVLILGNAALVIDPVSRAALLLFGALWLAAGLALVRQAQSGLPGAAVLVTLSAALGMAMAEGQALVYAAMLVCGYGVYALLAGLGDERLRRAGRALIVLLVISDVLVFEVLLGAAKAPGVELKPLYLVLLIIALMLRGGLAPAHVWLPPALVGMRTGAMVLVAVLPAATALYAAMRLLPGAVTELAPMFLVMGLVGALWVTLAGLVQTHYRAMLGYAIAATATLLLLSLPAAAISDGHLASLGLTLLACAAASLLITVVGPGSSRSAAAITLLVLHGLAGGQTAWHALAALPAFAVWVVPVVATIATLLLTFGALRGMQARTEQAVEGALVGTWTLIAVAALGLGMAWLDQGVILAALWIAPLAIAIGYGLFARLAGGGQPWIAPGDLLGPVEQGLTFVLRLARIICMRYLPILRDRFEATLAGLWKGEFWSRQIEEVDTRLRIWTATSVLMLAVAIAAAFLLVG